MIPLGKYVEVTAPANEYRSKGITRVGEPPNHIEATVLSVPDGVDEVSVGDKILHNSGGAIKKGNNYFVHIDQIVGILL